MNKLVAFILALSSTGMCWDKTFGYTSSLPGAIKFTDVMCKRQVSRSVCCNSAGKWYDVVDEYKLPPLHVLEQPQNFQRRIIPWANFSLEWEKQSFTFGDKIYAASPNLLLTTTTTCELGASTTISSNDESVWFQLVEGSSGFSVSYIGADLPGVIPSNSDVFNFQSCSQTSVDPNSACNKLRPEADPYFDALIKTGKVPGKILETWGADNSLPGQGGERMRSILYKVDPRTFFSGNLPVSWFTDEEAILKANARDSKGRLLQPFETFVASSAKFQPMYLGDGRFIEDQNRGYEFTEPNGKYLGYWASGAQIWTVDELKSMPGDKLLELPLPWMRVPLNQEDFYKPEWKDRDYKLHALAYGSDKPPIPPDRVLNLNPPDLQECPDMYQYYGLFKNCADYLLNTDDDVRITGLLNFMDQAAIDMDRDAGLADNTPYGEDGEFSPKAYSDPPPSKQFDLGSLKRTNPEGRENGDPFLATEFWLNMVWKHYCKYEAAGGCNDDWYDDGGKLDLPWWDDGYWKFGADFGVTWELRSNFLVQVSVTSSIKQYLARMTEFFQLISVPRDLLGEDSPLNIGFRRAGSYAVGAHQSINAKMPYPYNPKNYIEASFPDGTWFGGYSNDGTFSWLANISKDGYDTYKALAKADNYNWKVYVGNPGRRGALYKDEKEFVREGYYDPLATYIGDGLFHSSLTGDDGFRWGIIQTYPILFADNDGEVIPLGELQVHYKFFEDVEQSEWRWVGNNYEGDNVLVHNNAPVATTPEEEPYDPNSAEYQTDAYDPDERDELTWAQKKHAMWRITKMIATSEGLDLLMHILYENRKEIWYFAQKYGLEKAIRTTARWAKKAYRAYSSYRQTMDQARKVRDAARRLAGSRSLLEKTSGDIWNYYANFEWSKLRPDNLTKLLPMQLIKRQDYALWAFMENISDIANESSLLSKRIESYYTAGTGRSPGLVFARREQEHISSIAANNSTYKDEAQAAKLQQATEQSPALKNDPVHLWKLSGVLRGASQNISGTGLWLDNNYTRAAFLTLSMIETESRTAMMLRDRLQWQYSNFGSIFSATQAETKVDGVIGARLLKASNLFATPIYFQDLDVRENMFESALSNKSAAVITCGGKPCFGTKKAYP